MDVRTGAWAGCALAVGVGVGVVGAAAGEARAQCAEVVLRDTIHAEPGNPFGGVGGPTFTISDVGGGHWFVGVPLVVDRPVRLSTLDAVLASFNNVLNWSAFEFEVRLWTSPAAAALSPENGDAAPDVVIHGSTLTPVGGGVAISTVTGANVPAYAVRLSLEGGGGAVIQPGSYTLALAARRAGGNANGWVCAVGAEDPGEADLFFSAAHGVIPCDEYEPAMGVGRVAYRIAAVPVTCCGTADFDGDGDLGTDADIESFFACLGGTCCATCFAGGSDFNMDGDLGTDADIESFFRVLAGGAC